MAGDVVLVSREVHPFMSGGIGVYIGALARTLAEDRDVTVITMSAHADRFRQLRRAGEPTVSHERIRFEFVDDPRMDEIGSHYSSLHVWSARVFDALRRLYPDGGPALVEFPDYLGEGCVTVQAKAAGHPALRNTRVVVRMHTAAEMCDVLDGHLRNDFMTRSVHAMERYSLRHADRVLWAGGDIHATYERFYGADGLAPATRVRHPLILDTGAGEAPPPPSDGPVRFLYFGRMERRKGVQSLPRALTGSSQRDWRLTLLGGDTPTAPLGTSVAGQLELMAAGDERIEHLPAVPRSRVPALIQSHHAVLVPSLWECWPGVALEALACGRPLVATPVGGLVEMAVPGETGWRSADTSAEALGETLEEVMRSRDRLEALAGSPSLRRHVDRLTDPDGIRASYEELAAPPPVRRPRAARPPLVSAIVPYFKLDEYVEETLQSLFAQTHPALEVIVVNDGSIREEDLVLPELASRYPVSVLTQPNSGLGAARNFGVAQSRGKYVIPLDADNTIEPEFVERCVHALEHQPRWAYATTWSVYVDEDGVEHEAPARGYQPISNWLELIREGNVAGDATAVLRRRIFDLGHRYSHDLTSYEDWFFYRRLAAAGLYGHAIPERLLRYRVRRESMLREVGLPQLARLEGEMLAHEREAEVRWTYTSA